MSRGPLPFKIAWRYLSAPKSHGAVSAISVISVVGVAVATAAIIIVLSVFNGFRFFLNERLDTLTPDIFVAPSVGKTFEYGDSLKNLIGNIEGVEEVMEEVADNALVIADSREMPVKLKGVDMAVFSRISSIDSLLIDGNFVSNYNPRQASVSVGVAQRLGMYAAGDTLFLFAPKRYGRVNMANPMASFTSDSIQVASVFRSKQSDVDENTVIVDISTAREIFQYTTEATGLHIKALPGTSFPALTENIRQILGDEYIVKDRIEQQEVNFRMVAIEKWITFILLTFILLIASFNIISTLCMIILDKGNSLHTLSHLGMSKRRIGAIFAWESLLVTFIGGGTGLVLGIMISLMQEKFSILKLVGDPENLVLQAYPVRVEWLDILATSVPILIIGLIAAWISAVFARGRVEIVK